MSMFSVVICTYNRATILHETMESWLTVRNEGIDVEVVIVDNNSTDHTPTVVQSYSKTFPCPLKYIREEKAGLSHARNRGIDTSDGDVIVFVDDDVDFDKNWLVEIVKIFNKHKEIYSVGGKSIPKFAIEVPSWVTEDLSGYYGSTCSGDVDKEMVFPEHPFGLNMAFRRDVFDKIGNFDPNLGRVKRCLLSNEELDIFRRIDESGLTVYYASKAVLYHRIPESRIKKRWILERFYWQGVSDVITEDRILNRRTKSYFIKQVVGSIKFFIFPNNRFSPGKILRYYTKLPFSRRLHLNWRLGRLRQYTYELFS